MTGARSLKLIQPMQKDVSAETQDRADASCIGLAQDLPPEQVLRLATDLGYTHVIQKNGLEFDRELRCSEVLVSGPESFFQFPVATVFTPDDLSQTSERAVISADEFFNSSGQKRPVLENIVK